MNTPSSTSPRAADATYTIHQADGSSVEHAARWYEDGNIAFLLPRGQDGKIQEVSYDDGSDEVIAYGKRKIGISGISIHLTEIPEVHSEVSANSNEQGHYTNETVIRDFFARPQATPARAAGLKGP